MFWACSKLSVQLTRLYTLFTCLHTLFTRLYTLFTCLYTLFIRFYMLEGCWTAVAIVQKQTSCHSVTGPLEVTTTVQRPSSVTNVYKCVNNVYKRASSVHKPVRNVCKRVNNISVGRREVLSMPKTSFTRRLTRHSVTGP